MQNEVYVLYRMYLEQWNDLELATLNNGLALWGRINPRSNAYPRALEETLVKEDGYPTDDCLVRAVSDEVVARVAAGTFGKGDKRHGSIGQ